MKKVLNFINGEYLPGELNEWISSYNPATEEKVADVVNSTAQDAAFAIKSAEAAFPSWSKTPIEKRAKILSKMADLLKQKNEEFAFIETQDNGKPLAVARTIDIPRAAINLQFFSNAITQFHDNAFHMKGAVNYTRRQPLGVVTCISPWNLPLYLFTWKIAPAIAAGNCVVAKPSEVTPITASLMGELANEAGLPKGVLNIIHGQGVRVGEELIKNSVVRAVSFTGSTATGKIINQSAAPLFKKTSLEMGGKNATLVFEDCNYQKALNGAVRAAFSNQGQICLCGSRVLIQRSIYEKFKNDFITKVQELKVGDPLKEGTQQGALVSKEHFEKVLSCIQKAKDEGGKILIGGHRIGDKGYFISPTVFEGLGPESETNQHEIFGPVCTLQPFDTEEDAIHNANATSYGLACSIWSENSSRTHRVAEKIQAGLVWVNTWMIRDLRTPFGGMKESGVGREGGEDALRFFTEPKNICIQF